MIEVTSIVKQWLMDTAIANRIDLEDLDIRIDSADWHKLQELIH